MKPSSSVATAPVADSNPFDSRRCQPVRRTMRLLVIAARADFRLLVRKHVEIEWPDANLVEHRLGEDNPLDAQFAAVGFDAVIIVGVPPAAAAEALAAGLLAKPEFAPIVVLILDDAPNP